MTEEISQAELEANIRNELAELSGDNAYSGKKEDTEEETVEEETSEDSNTEEDSQPTEENEQETDAPIPEKKGKSNVPKILKERNVAREEAAYWKAKAEELASTKWGYEENDVEYISALASRIASEKIADDKFYSSNPSASEFKEKIEEYKKKHSLDTEVAYKLFLLEEQPEEFAVLGRKQEAKKSAPPAMANSKLRSDPKPAEMTTSQLEAELRKMLSKGELEF